MSKTNRFIFGCLQVVAWIFFIGLCIEAGGLLVNFFFSIYNPSFVSHLYNKLDLSAMYQQSNIAFYCMYAFILMVAILKALLFYVVISLIIKLDLRNPFSRFVSKQIDLMSYYTFSIGILSYVGRQSANSLQYRGYNVNGLLPYWADSEAFILMAAVIYIIAIIFKRGIEIQNENDLTV
jgi:hypothetical protein